MSLISDAVISKVSTAYMLTLLVEEFHKQLNDGSFIDIHCNYFPLSPLI
jgi:hypothetical protein